jgi:alkylation response protein AidB-like acyl-CoA dehydrogenase
MATNVEVAKTMNYRAMWDYQKARETGKKESSILALMAKRFASSSCLSVVLDAVQIHGSYGFIKEYPVERYYRDAKLLDIAGGTNEMLKLSIARILLK